MLQGKIQLKELQQAMWDIDRFFPPLPAIG
jgi:hypothetical protein